MALRPSHELLAAWEALLRFHRSATAMLGEQMQASVGLTLDHYDVMYQLSLAGGDGLRMTELTAVTLIARSSCSRLVDELTRVGLVERREDPDDRRAIRVRLTPVGSHTTRRAGAIHARGIRRLFGRRLDIEEARELARILDKLVARDN